MILYIAATKLLYSTSIELQEIVCCFFYFHDIMDLVNLITNPDIDILEFGHATQFAPQKQHWQLTSSQFNIILKHSSCFTYLTTLIATSQCDILGSYMN